MHVLSNTKQLYSVDDYANCTLVDPRIFTKLVENIALLDGTLYLPQAEGQLVDLGLYDVEDFDVFNQYIVVYQGDKTYIHHRVDASVSEALHEMTDKKIINVKDCIYRNSTYKGYFTVDLYEGAKIKFPNYTSSWFMMGLNCSVQICVDQFHGKSKKLCRVILGETHKSSREMINPRKNNLFEVIVENGLASCRPLHKFSEH